MFAVILSCYYKLIAACLEMLQCIQNDLVLLDSVTSIVGHGNWLSENIVHTNIILILVFMSSWTPVLYISS